ncbi:MAG: LCP family protein, partial [Pseudonocardia sp.]
MPDGTEPTPPARSRRGQLTVAELLARHAADTATTRAAAPARDFPARGSAPAHNSAAHDWAPVHDSPAHDWAPGAEPVDGQIPRRSDDELPQPRRSTEPPPAGPPSAPPPAAPEVTDQIILNPAEAPTALVDRIPATQPRSAAEHGSASAPDAPTSGAASPEDPDRAQVADAPDGREDELALRARRIDESLMRLTAIHAGLGSEMSARVSRSSRLPIVHRSAASGDSTQGDPTQGDPGLSRHGGPPSGGRPGGVAGLLAARPPAGLVRVARAALVALAVVAFVATGLGWGTKSWLDSQLRPVAALDPNSDSIVDKAGQDGDLNYLLVGSDTRAGVEAGSADAGRVASTKAVPGAPSDTVMLAHIPAERDRVVLVSFPRDLQVDRPNCDRWDRAGADYPGGTSPAESGVKLNTAFEIGGPRCVTKVLQKLTGLSINHFTAIDLVGFKEMVDAVQGVPICLDRPVVDSVLGQVVPTAGQTVLTGEQALAFVRARNVRGDPASDRGRIERQQRFLSALLRKGLSEQVLLDPGRLSAFVGAFGAHTLSDNAGLDELGTLAGALRNLDP